MLIAILLIAGCKANVTTALSVVRFTVTASAGVNGSITANPLIPSDGKVAKASEITFTATANTGYHVDAWAITGGLLQSGGQAGDTSAKVKISANTTVNITFKLRKSVVEYGENGAALEAYLKSLPDSATEINNIEIIGLTHVDIKGSYGPKPNSASLPSPLGKLLARYPAKKIALKFGATVETTDMRCCFAGCANLVEVSGIPNTVTDMRDCFDSCTNLTQVPKLPDAVTDMSRCFYRCTSLTQAPEIPKNVIKMESCFLLCQKLKSVTFKCDYQRNIFNQDTFSGCTSLTKDSIKVPANQLEEYKKNADDMGAKKDWFIAE